MKMKTSMEEGSECFQIGSHVICETCHKKKLEGEVLAFDPHTKMLILKCLSGNGRPNAYDVHMVNLNYVSDVSVQKEASSNPPQTQCLNLQRLSRRAELNITEKLRMANAMAAGVSPEGQMLFLAISKTYSEVTWEGKNIVVLNQVTITPPYQPENCQGPKSDDQAASRIRKIIEKHMKEQAQSPENAPNSTVSTAQA